MAIFILINGALNADLASLDAARCFSRQQHLTV
jgi:hypothetical protein